MDALTDDFTVETNAPDPAVVATAVDTVVETEPAETKVEPETEKPTNESVKTDAERNPDGTFKAKPKKGSLDRLIWEREEAERKAKAAEERAAAAERRAQELEARREAAKPAETPKAEAKTDPAVGKFTFAAYDEWTEKHPDRTYEDYIAARVRAEIKFEHEQEERTKTQETERAEFERVRTAHVARIAAFQQTHPDLEEKGRALEPHLVAAGFAGDKFPLTLTKAIMTSDKSADILYDLASHPEACIQLAREAAELPLTAAPVMRRVLESRLTAAPSGPAVTPKPVTPAKEPPIKPVAGSSLPSDDEPPGDDADFDAHKRYWDRKDKEARRR